MSTRGMRYEERAPAPPVTHLLRSTELPDGQPVVGGRCAAHRGAQGECGRSFSLAQWQFIEGQLKMLTSTSANQRLTFGLHLLYATGLRLSEVVTATVDDLQWVK